MNDKIRPNEMLIISLLLFLAFFFTGGYFYIDLKPQLDDCNKELDIINQKQMIVDEMTYYVNNKEEFQDNLIIKAIKE